MAALSSGPGVFIARTWNSGVVHVRSKWRTLKRQRPSEHLLSTSKYRPIAKMIGPFAVSEVIVI
jgi:hypothetical protein